MIFLTFAVSYNSTATARSPVVDSTERFIGSRQTPPITRFAVLSSAFLCFLDYHPVIFLPFSSVSLTGHNIIG